MTLPLLAPALWPAFPPLPPQLLPLSTRIAYTLLHSTWQGALLAILLYLTLTLLPRASANLRYLLSCSALLLLLASTTITFSLLQPTPTILPSATSTPSPLQISPLPSSFHPSSFPALSLSKGIPHPFPPSPHPPSSLLPLLTPLWSAGVLTLTLLHLLGYLRLRHLTHTSTPPLNQTLHQTLQSLATRLHLTRPIRLLESPHLTIPATLGHLRPILLLPIGLLTDLTPSQLESILAHELAHIKRHDYLANLLQTAVETLFFYHPATWYISRQIRQEREHCCDDLALSLTHDPATYARALTTLEQRRSLHFSLAPSATGGSLLHRIRRILHKPSPTPRRPAPLAALLLILACFTATLYFTQHSARAAIKKFSPTTHPITADKVPPHEIGLRITDPAGKPIDIDDISQITVHIDQGPWSLGPKPQILHRLPDGVVTVTDHHLTLSKPGQHIEIIFRASNGAVATAYGVYQKSDIQTLRATSPAQSLGIDLLAGPTPAADDELAGRIIDSAGNPIAGVVVSTPRGTSPLPPLAPPATTDSNGVFRFPHWTIRYANFQFDKPGYARRWLTDLPVGQGFSIRLDNSTHLQGSLQLQNGQPASNTSITLTGSRPTIGRAMYNPAEMVRLDLKTDDQGHYDTLIDPGLYDISVQSPAGQSARFDLNIPLGHSVQLPSQLQTGPTLRVLLVDSLTGKPVPNAKLWIDDRQPGSYIGVKPDSQRTTDPTGHAHWDYLVPGLTYLHPKADGYARWWMEPVNPILPDRGIDDLFITVTPNMPELTIKMEPAVQITGHILAPDNSPIPHAQINVNGIITGDNRYMTTADANGLYSISFPADLHFPGQKNPPHITLVAHDPSYHYANSISDPIPPTPGLKSILDLHLSPGSHITGRVVDDNGNPLPNIGIEANTQAHIDTYYLKPRALTDATGHFDLGPLRPHTYHLQPDPRLFGNPHHDWKQVDVPPGQNIDLGDLPFSNPPKPDPKNQEYLQQQFGHPPTTLPHTATPSSSILPEDLTPDTATPHLSPGDMVKLTLTNPANPLAQTPRFIPITPDGNADLPTIGPLHLADLPDDKALAAITQAYHNSPLQVTVQLSKTSNNFEIAGDTILSPGQHSLADKPNMRLTDAIALAGDLGSADGLIIYRRSPTPRQIKIDLQKLRAGDPSLNLPIRPHDTLYFTSPPGAQPSTKISPNPNPYIYLLGEPSISGAYSTTKATLGSLLAAHHLSPNVHYLTLLRRDANHRTLVLKNIEIPAKYSLPNDIAQTPLQADDTILITLIPLNAPAQLPDLIPSAHPNQIGEYYIAGAARPGVYSLTGRRITALQALATAGGLDHPETSYTVLLRRRETPDKESLPLNNIPLQSLLTGSSPDIELQPNDILFLNPATNAALTTHHAESKPREDSDFPRLQFRSVLPDNDPAPADLIANPSIKGQTLRLSKEILFTESDVTRADATTPDSLTLHFTPQAGQRFSAYTASHINHRLAILFDGKLLLAPNINSQIGSTVLITVTHQQATQIATALNTGKPPTTYPSTQHAESEPREDSDSPFHPNSNIFPPTTRIIEKHTVSYYLNDPATSNLPSHPYFQSDVPLRLSPYIEAQSSPTRTKSSKSSPSYSLYPTTQNTSSGKPPSTPPTTHPTPPAILPQDLIPPPTTSQLTPNDSIEITLTDPANPTQPTKRFGLLTPAGDILIPSLPPIHPADLTLPHVTAAITQAYANTPLHASIKIAKRYGNYTIEGDAIWRIESPSITQPDMRLSQALAHLDLGSSNGLTIYRLNPDHRQIQIDLPKLLAGNPSLNLIIHPDDILHFSAPPGAQPLPKLPPDPSTRYFVLGQSPIANAYTSPTPAMPTLGKAITPRSLTPDSRFITIFRRDASRRTIILKNIEATPQKPLPDNIASTPLQSNDLILLTPAPLNLPAALPDILPPSHPNHFGECLIVPSVLRPGVYTLDPRHPLTALQALATAGGLDHPDPSCTLLLIRRQADQYSFPINNVPLQSLLTGLSPDIDLQPNDILESGPSQNTP